MDKPFRFAIPEAISRVLDWFTEALELEVRRLGNPGVELSVEGPRSRTLHGSDGNTTVMEIVILGFRTLGKPIPSDWAPEYCIADMERVWEPLGSVMAFQFAALGGSTRVWATFEEQHPGVQVLFEEFLQRIDANYPMDESLARRYRTQCDLQLMERIDRHLTAESHDADASVGAPIEGGTAGAAVEAQLPAMFPHKEQVQKMAQVGEMAPEAGVTANPTAPQLSSAGQPTSVPDEQRMAGAASAQASEIVGTGQTVETPAPAKRADGVRRPRVSQARKALAEKTLELRALDIDLSQREVAAYIETHCTEEEKAGLKRGWGPRSPINKDDVDNAWSRMQEIRGWPAWEEDRLPARD
jgi:hypothetical protein